MGIADDAREPARMHRFFELCTDLLVVLDPAGTIVEMGTAWSAHFADPSDEAPRSTRGPAGAGRPVTDLIVPEDRDAARATIARAHEKPGHPCRVQARGRGRDGAVRTFEWTFAHYADERLTYAVARDRSELRHAEDRVREGEARIRAILETAVAGVLTLDEDGIVRAMNPASERLFGTSASAAVGGSVGRLLPSMVTEAGLSSTCLERPGPCEIVGCREGGEPFPLELSVSELSLDGKRMFTCVLRDLSERKIAESALKESEERYRDLFESASDLIQAVGPDGHFLYVNPAWTRTLGYSAHDLSQLVLPDLIAPESLQHCMSTFARVLAGDRLDRIEAIFCTKDGRRVHVEGSVSTRFEKGIPIATRGIFRDVTERRRVERLKNEFVATVSHELRTPLTSIRGSLGLLAAGVAGPLSPQAGAMIKIAHTNCERLVRLINDILDIEKIESGRMDFQLRPMEILPQLEQVVDANRPFAEQLGVRLEVARPPQPVAVTADPDRLMQVLTNLVSNAAKFSPRGAAVTVWAERRGAQVRVSVRDRGAGIPADFRGRVFGKFAQADASDSRQKGGTGLGLAISKAIVEHMGGTIGFADAEDGGGTVFYFDLPAADAPRRTTVQPRVLVCEADRDIARLLCMLLERETFLADVAPSPEDARRLLRSGSYVAMTVDLAPRAAQIPDGGPVEDWVGLLKELREVPERGQLSVVVVSAHRAEGRQELDGYATRIVDWLEKPIDPERLLDAVRLATDAAGHALRVLHVESEPEHRRLVDGILAGRAEVTEATSADAAAAALDRQRFDLVILDLALKDGPGLDLLAHAGTTPVLVFSERELPPDEASRFSASLHKTRSSPDELRRAILSLLPPAPP